MPSPVQNHGRYGDLMQVQCCVQMAEMHMGDPGAACGILPPARTAGRIQGAARQSLWSASCPVQRIGRAIGSMVRPDAGNPSAAA